MSHNKRAVRRQRTIGKRHRLKRLRFLSRRRGQSLKARVMGFAAAAALPLASLAAPLSASAAGPRPAPPGALPTLGQALPAAITGPTGTTVKLTGSNFGTGTAEVAFRDVRTFNLVSISGSCATATSTGCIVSQSASAISAKTPPGLMGGQFVTASLGGQPVAELTAAAPLFVNGPLVTKMSPNAGTSSTKVTLTGANFGTNTSAVEVGLMNENYNLFSIGGACATSTSTGCIVSVKPTSIVFKPPSLGGLVTVAVVQVGVNSVMAVDTTAVPPYVTSQAYGYNTATISKLVFAYGPAVTALALPAKSTTPIKITGVNLGAKTTSAAVGFTSLDTGMQHLVTVSCGGTVKDDCIASHTPTSITVKPPTTSPLLGAQAVDVFIGGSTMGNLAGNMIYGGGGTGQLALFGAYLCGMSACAPGPAVHFGKLITDASPDVSKAGAAIKMSGVNLSTSTPYVMLTNLMNYSNTIVTATCATAASTNCVSNPTTSGFSVKPPTSLRGTQLIRVSYDGGSTFVDGGALAAIGATLTKVS